MPDGTGVSASAVTLESGHGFMRRAVSALFSPLRKRRRLLPPPDDHLRRDIGLREREVPTEYWEYWWYHH